MPTPPGWQRPSTRSPRRSGGARLPELSGPFQPARRNLPAVLLLEVDRLAARHVRPEHRGEPLDPGRRPEHAALEHGRPATVRSQLRDPRVAQMLDHFTQYVGSSPDLSPAVLCGIAHMQTGEGVWYPRGGTRAVAEALIRLAGDLGVELRTGCGVRTILTEAAEGRQGSRARRRPARPAGRRGVELLTRCEPIASCLSGTVAAQALREAPRRTRRPARASSSTWVSTAVRAAPAPQFRLLARPARGVRHHLSQGRAGRRPDVLRLRPGGHRAGCRTTWRRSTLRAGSHAVISDRTTTGDAATRDYRETILDKLAATAGLADIKERIKVEHWLTPQDIHDRYRVLDGAIYGLASHGRFTVRSSRPTAAPTWRGFTWPAALLTPDRACPW